MQLFSSGKTLPLTGNGGCEQALAAAVRGGHVARGKNSNNNKRLGGLGGELCEIVLEFGLEFDLGGFDHSMLENNAALAGFGFLLRLSECLGIASYPSSRFGWKTCFVVRGSQEGVAPNKG
jgi:hypothetical protein